MEGELPPFGPGGCPSNAIRDETSKKTNITSMSKEELFGFLVAGSEYHQRNNNQAGKTRNHQDATGDEISQKLRRMRTAPTMRNTPAERNNEPSSRRTPLPCLRCALDRKFECKWCGSTYKTRDDRKAHIARRHPYKLKSDRRAG